MGLLLAIRELFLLVLLGLFLFGAVGYSADLETVKKKIPHAKVFQKISLNLFEEKEGSTQPLLVTFGDISGQYGFSTVLRHLPLCELNIRDDQEQWYLGEYIQAEELGSRTQKLEDILPSFFGLDEFKGQKITLLGSSMGGFAAIYYGAILSPYVRRVLAFSPQTVLNQLSFGYQPKSLEIGSVRLRDLVPQAKNTEFHIILRDDNAADVFHAMDLCDLSNVRCYFIHGQEAVGEFLCDHNTPRQYQEKYGKLALRTLIYEAVTGADFSVPLDLSYASASVYEVYQRLLDMSRIKGPSSTRGSDLNDLEVTPQDGVAVQWAKAYELRDRGDLAGFFAFMKVCLEQKNYRKMWHDVLDVLYTFGNPEKPNTLRPIEKGVGHQARKVIEVYRERYLKETPLEKREEYIKSRILLWEKVLN